MTRWAGGVATTGLRTEAPDWTDEPSDPWPSLPDPRPDDRASSVALALRERDHEQRLDLEQRGVPWSA
jgi:hypothetical protein